MSKEKSIEVNSISKSIYYNINNTLITRNKTNDIRKENFLKKLDEIKHSMHQRNIESNRTRYTKSAISERIKQELASVSFDVNKYKDKIAEYKMTRSPNQCYYDYDLELDFSDNPKISFNIDVRWYYYKAHHFKKLGLFSKKDVPAFKIQKSHLSSEMVYELKQLDYPDQQFVLKQAVSRIFEDINFELYHNSISAKLAVKLID